MSATRWYQTTPDRVQVIVSRLLAAVGYLAMALHFIGHFVTKRDDVELLAVGTLLVLYDLIRRVDALEDRR